jgi:phosphohistidine swiveling domain-containing protein
MTPQDILEKEWINYGRWTQGTLSGAFWAHWQETSFGEVFSKELPLPEILFLDGYTLSPKEEHDAVKDFMLSAYNNKTLEDWFLRFQKETLKREVKLVALLERQDLPVAAYTKELLLNFLELVTPWALLFRYSSSLEEIAIEQGLARDESDIVAKIRPYTQITWLEKQTAEINELARQVSESIANTATEDMTVEKLSTHAPRVLENIRKHVQEFSWFGTHHWEGDGYTLEKAITDIQNTLKKSLQEQFVKKTGDVSDPENELVWKILADFVYWRTHCAEVCAKVVFESRDILIGIATNWGLTYQELIYLSATEITEALGKDEHSITLPDNFQERFNGYGCYVENGTEQVIVGEVLQKYIDAVIPKVETNITELKGTIASKGAVVTGEVRVVMGPKDFANFQEGHILVANETSPDFVPLMKQAAAIVTDTGGITSHAAIVSRELKKPCITGTKIATKIFKDGDIVEVDAEKGIVRII